jgi:Ser/Thr protein kinase RdoA (MazF antagonist)
VTARLHEHGYAHKDYGRANILFQKTPNGITIEIVDLNRMYIGPIDMKTGCKNFERLPATPQMHRWMAEEYAKARNFDVEKCFELMRAYRSVQPGKIDNLY